MSNPSTDPLIEIEALKTIAEALSPLDEGGRSRVLKWAFDRFLGIRETNFNVEKEAEPGKDRSPAENASAAKQSAYGSIAEFYATVSPDTDADRVLCVSYWFQVICGENDVDAQRINKELKHLGHGISNVTMAFSSLISRKPQLVIQTKKSGNSQQARKRYLVTAEGKKVIEAKTVTML